MRTLSMERTQVYLTEGQKQALEVLVARTGIKQSELIRQAIDILLERKGMEEEDWKATLKLIKGIWSDYPEAEDNIRSARQSIDHRFHNER